MKMNNSQPNISAERTANWIHAKKLLKELKEVEKSMEDMVVKRVDRNTIVSAPADNMCHVLKAIARSQNQN